MDMMSDRYKKALVTVMMGFRTEADIKNNGLYRFTKEDILSLKEYVINLFNKNKNVLALKIKPIGFKSEHINIKSNNDLNNFLSNVSNLFDSDISGSENEIWVVSSSVIECWRCRIGIMNDGTDIIEMAYSFDDHILDHIDFKSNVPYICYRMKNERLGIINSNLKRKMIGETNFIVNDLYNKYGDVIKGVKHDLKFLNVNSISLDVRINDGYDFHDFDASFDDVKKIIDHYMLRLEYSKVKRR